MTDKIRVLLAEDHAIVRKGVRSLLDDEPGIQVIGEAKDGRQAIAKAEELCPDVVVMEITMPGVNGVESTRRIRKRVPGAKVVVLTMHANERYVKDTLRAGASGYVVKQAAPAELVMAIQAVSRDEYYLRVLR